MLMDAIVFHPGAVAVLASTGLAMFAFVWLDEQRRYLLSSVIILLPLAPLALLRLCAMGVICACDELAQNLPGAATMIERAKWIERTYL